MSTYSQGLLKNTLTHQNNSHINITVTITPTLSDSVKVPFIYVKAANKAFIEIKSAKILAKLYENQSSAKDLEIMYLSSANSKCEQAYDTLSLKTIPALKKESDDNAKLYADFKKAYKVEHLKVIGISVGVPVATFLGFLTGFLLFHK